MQIIEIDGVNVILHGSEKMSSGDVLDLAKWLNADGNNAEEEVEKVREILRYLANKMAQGHITIR
ncbi:hypothetical protein PZ897_01985 [Hoeflea sp. YIM 152468]|uniref:hypothetical protein n=1 Tax=Hoeflea sp. YIM 152468 TaxID=3031759 RepID=UPI0023DB414E|nr:hypothetical protein [Hoeflea sp. YIM 152468]MDF1606940.1 hypothetical protein [Hoeflea sp. YIM 152468]